MYTLCEKRLTLSFAVTLLCLHQCALDYGIGQNVQFYCERFDTTFRDAVTLAKSDKDMLWQALLYDTMMMVI